MTLVKCRHASYFPRSQVFLDHQYCTNVGVCNRFTGQKVWCRKAKKKAFFIDIKRVYEFPRLALKAEIKFLDTSDRLDDPFIFSENVSLK